MSDNYCIIENLYKITLEFLQKSIESVDYSDINFFIENINENDFYTKIVLADNVTAFCNLREQIKKYQKNINYFDNKGRKLSEESTELFKILDDFSCESKKISTELLRDLMLRIINFESIYPECKLIRYKLVNPVIEFNRKYNELLADKESKAYFETIASANDCNKKILYSNITAPIFTAELREELLCILSDLSTHKHRNDYEKYKYRLISRVLRDLISCNNSIKDIN